MNGGTGYADRCRQKPQNARRITPFDFWHKKEPRELSEDINQAPREKSNAYFFQRQRSPCATAQGLLYLFITRQPRTKTFSSTRGIRTVGIKSRKGRKEKMGGMHRIESVKYENLLSNAKSFAVRNASSDPLRDAVFGIYRAARLHIFRNLQRVSGPGCPQGTLHAACRRVGTADATRTTPQGRCGCGPPKHPIALIKSSVTHSCIQYVRKSYSEA